MRRGTTPTITFTTGIEASEIVTAYITFAQGSQIVLDKNSDEDDIVIQDNELILYLTQKDTLLFAKSGRPTAQVQVRLALQNDKAAASNIVTVNVDQILKDGEI